MKRMEGYLTGLPKVLENLSYDFLQKQNGYFVRIKIKQLNKHLDFPLVSKFSNSGVRVFTNNMEDEILYIDKVGLEDLIEFQKVEFTILDGYYFNDGRNNKINTVISELYELRLQLKKAKNPAVIVIKLLMHSMYGKTILKPIETDTIIKDGREEFEKYVSYNYNYIDSIIEVDGRFFIKRVKSVMEHFNYVHCGVEILSQSKRIMNEVFGCADDLKLKIYYQDTDSIHMNYDDVDKLAAKYNIKYDRELVGAGMGNFHVDFSMKGASGEIYATESYFLGKKTYIDALESKDKDGNTIKEEHIRMRGIPNACIKYKADNDKVSVMDTYKQLYDGESIIYDLTNDGSKVNFKFNKDCTVSTVSEFTRTTKFINNDKEYIT